MSKRISSSRPSIFTSLRNRIPGKMSGRGYVMMMAALGVLAVLLAGILAFLLAWTAADAPWVLSVGAALTLIPVVVLVLLTVAAFIYGLRIALYLTRSKQWHAFIGFWLDWFAKGKDRFSSVTTSMRIARKRLAGPVAGGFLVSMAPEQRFPKLPARQLTLNDDRHVVLKAASRGGKGRSVIVPNLLGWQGSVIVNDPASENYKLTARHRREVLGQKVILLDPFGITGDISDTWNPMAEIDWARDPFALDKANMLAESLYDAGGGDPYWTHAARKMLAMMIAYVGASAFEDNCNLGEVRNLLMEQDMQSVWTAMQKSNAYGGELARFGAANMGRAENELASVLEIARMAFNFIASGPMTNFTRASTFSMKELKDGQTSVYVVLPAGAGESYKGWLRVLFDSAFDAMQDMSMPKPDVSTLFVLDEFPLLGRMDRIKRAAGEAAKFGVKLFICAQDIGQLKEIYGHDGWETFIANSGLLIMFANNDMASLEYLSSRLGQEIRKTYSGSSGPGGSSSSWSEQVMPVARPDEATKQASRQSGEAFIFIQGEKPMRLPRANYDEWDMLPSNPQDSE